MMVLQHKEKMNTEKGNLCYFTDLLSLCSFVSEICLHSTGCLSVLGGWVLPDPRHSCRLAVPALVKGSPSQQTQTPTKDCRSFGF